MTCLRIGHAPPKENHSVLSYIDREVVFGLISVVVALSRWETHAYIDLVTNGPRDLNRQRVLNTRF